jgi:hypothetical protein
MGAGVGAVARLAVTICYNKVIAHAAGPWHNIFTVIDETSPGPTGNRGQFFHNQRTLQA